MSKLITEGLIKVATVAKTIRISMTCYPPLPHLLMFSKVGRFIPYTLKLFSVYKLDDRSLDDLSLTDFRIKFTFE